MGIVGSGLRGGLVRGECSGSARTSLDAMTANHLFLYLYSC